MISPSECRRYHPDLLPGNFAEYFWRIEGELTAILLIQAKEPNMIFPSECRRYHPDLLPGDFAEYFWRIEGELTAILRDYQGANIEYNLTAALQRPGDLAGGGPLGYDDFREVDRFVKALCYRLSDHGWSVRVDGWGGPEVRRRASEVKLIIFPKPYSAMH